MLTWTNVLLTKFSWCLVADIWHVCCTWWPGTPPVAAKCASSCWQSVDITSPPSWPSLLLLIKVLPWRTVLALLAEVLSTRRVWLLSCRIVLKSGGVVLFPGRLGRMALLPGGVGLLPGGVVVLPGGFVLFPGRLVLWPGREMLLAEVLAVLLLACKVAWRLVINGMMLPGTTRAPDSPGKHNWLFSIYLYTDRWQCNRKNCKKPWLGWVKMLMQFDN